MCPPPTRTQFFSKNTNKMGVSPINVFVKCVFSYLKNLLYETCFFLPLNSISPRGTKSTSISSLPTAQCYHNFNDLLSFKVFDMLHVLGPKLHSDPLLLCKIIRIGKACFKDLFAQCPPSDGNGGLKYEVLEKVSKHTCATFHVFVFICLCFFLKNFHQ